MQLFVFIVFLVISLSFAKPQPSRARFILTVGYRERAVLQLRAGSDSVTDSNIHKIPANVDRCTSRPLEVIAKRLVVGTLFLAWYILNVGYNILNKKTLKILPLPVSLAALQLLVGSVWAACLWQTGLRQKPKLSEVDISGLLKVACFHGGGQLATVLSLGAGTLSATHIVKCDYLTTHLLGAIKAMEPFFSALLAAVAFGQRLPIHVYATLLPVVGGVSIACMALAGNGESSFSWNSFTFANISNLLFAGRSNWSKVLMGKSLSAANIFALTTTLSAALLVPVAILTEGISGKAMQAWNVAVADVSEAGYLLLVSNALLSGLTHYLNNEVMYMTLSMVDPVTLAVGNTLKRVFILLAGVIVFGDKFSLLSGGGSAIAILGVLVYSLARQRHDAAVLKKQ